MMKGLGNTVRFRLACLVAACVLPVWVAAAALVAYSYQTQSEEIRRHLLETARALRLTVDREVATLQTAMRVLATSPLLASGDLAGFHAQAHGVAGTFAGSDIIMADATGQQVVNTFLPYGQPLPRRNEPALVRRVFEAGKPLVSGVFKGAATGRPLFSVDVPVFLAGAVAYDLGIGLPTDRLGAILSQQRLPRHWIGTILDGNNVVAARTRYPDAFVGQSANDDFTRMAATADEGVSEITNLEGVAVVAAFDRSAESGWSVVIAVPTEVLTADLKRRLAWTILGVVLLSAAGLALGLAMAGRMARAIQALIPPAEALGRGEAVVVAASGLAETAAVSQALARTSDLLRRRADELVAEIDSHRATLGHLTVAHAAAETANQAKARFLATASHDLHQPLYAARLHSEAIAAHIAPAGAESLDKLGACLDSLWAFTDELMTLCKFDIHLEEPQLAEVRLDEPIRRAATVHRAQAEAKGLDLRVVPTTLTATTDAALLHRILINLLHNAVCYSERGGIVVGCRRRGDTVRVEVWDTGSGIAEDHLSDIFEEFYRGRQDEPDGLLRSGLGLAIVKRAADLLDHRIEVCSRPGRGSMFAVVLDQAG